jgi:hypothetical protein
MVSKSCFLPALLSVTFLANGKAAADDPVASGSTSGQHELPTADQFYLKIDHLIDNVADLDVRRFTLVAPEGRTLKFHVGEAGMGSKGQRLPTDDPSVRRLEAIVLLRLQEGADRANTKIRRLLKFHRTKGAAVETEFDAPGRQSLRDIVEINVSSGRYAIGKPLTVGTIHGQPVVVSVE